MPIAAATHSVAAVVRPRTERPWRMIAPAPRKPIPVTICAAIRVGSARITLVPEVRNAWKPYAETIVKSAEPSETSRCVRRPASRSRSSRSSPIAAPRAAASASRRNTSHQSSVGRLCTERALLGLEDVAIHPERPLAERLEVRHRPQRAADQPLDLDRAPALLPARGLALGSLTGRGGEERGLGGEAAPPPP